AENKNSGRVSAANGHRTTRGNGWSETSPKSWRAPRMLDGGAARYARVTAAATIATAAVSMATGSHATRRLLALADRSRARASDLIAVMRRSAMPVSAGPDATSAGRMNRAGAVPSRRVRAELRAADERAPRSRLKNEKYIYATPTMAPMRYRGSRSRRSRTRA